MIAGQYQIPEVMIFFGNQLLRGNRSTKISTHKMQAFQSPNYRPLGEVGVDFKIYWDRILTHSFEGKIQLFTEMSEDIAMITIMPSMNIKVVESVLHNSKAVVLVAYGMGNVPSGN